MEYSEKIDSVQGNYIVTDDKVSFECLLDKSDLHIADSVIKTGEETDFFGWFTVAVRYCGLLDKNKAIFYIGQNHSTLFDPTLHFYDVTFIITKERIGKSYKSGTFRDSFFKQLNNKMYWK